MVITLQVTHPARMLTKTNPAIQQVIKTTVITANNFLPIKQIKKNRLNVERRFFLCK